MTEQQKVDSVWAFVYRLFQDILAMPKSAKKTGTLVIFVLGVWSSCLWFIAGGTCSVSVSQTFFIGQNKNSSEQPSAEPPLAMQAGWVNTENKHSSLAVEYHPTPEEERASACLPAWSS